MRKYIVVFGLSILSVLLSEGAQARSYGINPSDTTHVEKIDSSVVSAYNFYENSISAFGSHLIGLNTLNLSKNATLEQSLRLMPCIDIRERGGKSIQTDIGIRGGGSDQTGILLNGVDFTDFRTGHQSHSLPIDSDVLQEIKLLDGGNQGLTGAINMIAGGLYSDYLRLNLSGGDHGYAYANISGATSIQTKGILDVFAAGSMKRSDGYRESTDFVNYNLYARVKYSNSKVGTFDSQIGFQDRAFGANGFYSLKYPDQFEKTGTSLASIRWNKTLDRFILESYVSYRHNTDRFELIRGSEDKVPFNYHITNNYGAYLSSSYVWLAGRTSLSGEFHHGDIISTVLGELLDTPKDIKGRTDRFYTKGKTRDWGNVQLRHQKQWGKFGIKAALEGDFSPYGFTPLWNAGLNWDVTENWSFDVLGAKTMRLPTFTDLYYTATGYIGDPNLNPELATLFKAGAAFNKGGFAFSADAFYRHGTNIIDWVREDAMSDWMSSQITAVNTIGADVTAKYRLESGVLKSVTAMAGYISMDKSSEGLISRYALDYMKLKASVIADFAFGKHWTMSANMSYYNREGNYSSVSGETLSYKPYALLNANISYEVGSMKLYVDLDNVTSTKYFDYGGLPMPGIWAMGGMIITLRK